MQSNRHHGCQGRAWQRRSAHLWQPGTREQKRAWEVCLLKQSSPANDFCWLFASLRTHPATQQTDPPSPTVPAQIALPLRSPTSYDDIILTNLPTSGCRLPLPCPFTSPWRVLWSPLLCFCEMRSHLPILHAQGSHPGSKHSPGSPAPSGAPVPLFPQCWSVAGAPSSTVLTT